MSKIFFNSLNGCLSIETSEKPKRIGSLLNQYCEPTTKVISVSWEPNIFENDNFRELTEEELERVVFEEKTLLIRSHACLHPSALIEHKATKHFTVRDMIKVVCDTELATRSDTEWFGGIDVHHVFFEGIHLLDGVWTIGWGS